MPVSATTIFLGCMRPRTNSLLDSIPTETVVHHKNAKKKFKSNPNAILRPPPGMTRRELRQDAQRKLRMDVVNYYNFAFCGGSGAGKSTLINALLNRDDVEFVAGKEHNIFGSAPTGEWQTTMDTLCYAYPSGHELQYVRLWDTAGLGTYEHPSTKYFEDKCLYAFDVLMIVAEKELGEYEYTLLENAEKQKMSTIVVITKAEEKVNAKIRKLYNTRNPPFQCYKQVVYDTANEARERVLSCLHKKGFHKVPVFVVSAWRYRDYMMEQERLANFTDQQTTSSNSKVGEGESLSQQISNQGINHDILIDDHIQEQETIEHDSLTKMTLFAFEVTCLLDYIAGVALHRRL